tara:strand:+ start:813 stop:1358 length:546 start_codon:yes stop_codon:yes gene_type:complete
MSGIIGEAGNKSGIIGDVPAGTIVQAVSGSIPNSGSTLNFTSSVAEQSTGLDVGITPKFSNSKIYVMASLNASSVGENCGVFWKVDVSGLTTRRSFDSQTTYGSSWRTGAMIGVVSGWNDDGVAISHHWEDTAQSNTVQHNYTLMANAADTSSGTYLAMNHRGNDGNFGSVSYCLAMEIKV